MQYQFLKKEHEKFPPIVHIENTNICNIKCIHCPQSDPYNLVPGYKPQSMKTEIFKKIVEQIGDYPCALRMTPDGETLLPGNFSNMLDIVFSNNTHLFTFNTNGLLMEKNILAKLLEPKQTKVAIEISLDALYKDNYDSIRVGSNYNRVLKNIFTLLYERNKLNLQNQLKIMVSIVRQPELRVGEHDAFMEFWEPIVDKVIKRSYVDTKQLMPEKKVDDEEIKKEDRWPCLVPFTRIIVTYDGSIRFCPDDWRKETVIGNINDNTIAELWRSGIMNRLRQSHLDRTFQHTTCQYCTDWKVIKWGYDYTVALNDLFGAEVI